MRRALIATVCLAACGEEPAPQAEKVLFFEHGVQIAQPAPLTEARTVLMAAWHHLAPQRVLFSFVEDTILSIRAGEMEGDSELRIRARERANGFSRIGEPCGAEVSDEADQPWTVFLSAPSPITLAMQSSVLHPDGAWSGHVLLVGRGPGDPQVKDSLPALDRPEGVADICYRIQGGSFDLIVNNSHLVRSGGREEWTIRDVELRTGDNRRARGTVHARWNPRGGIATFDGLTVGDSTPYTARECWDENFAPTERCIEP